MSEPLWRLQDLEHLTTHPSDLVRDWVRDRVEHLPLGPDASRILLRLLNDPDEKIVSLSAVHVRETGDAHTGPALLDVLPRYHGNTAGNLMMALGRLRYAPSLPMLLERLQQPQDFSEYLGNVIALAQFGGDRVRAILLKEWTNAPENEMAVSAVAGALLTLDDDTVIALIVAKYLQAPPQYNRLLKDLRHTLQIDWICENLSDAVKRDLDAVCTELREEYHLPMEEIFSEEARAQLARDWSKPRGLAERAAIYAQVAREAVGRRGLETASSKFARQSMRWLAALDAFAQHLHRTQVQVSRDQLTKLDDAGARELETFLIVTATLAGGSRDYHTEIQSVSDRVVALWKLWLADDPFVPDDLGDEIAALGAAAIPRLAAMVQPEHFTWGGERAATTLAKIARATPQDAAMLAPIAVEWLAHDAIDMILEAGRDILVALGETSLDAIAAVMPGQNSRQQIYLLGALGDIPYAGSAQLILDHLESLLIAHDELTFNALRDLGCASAIEPLRAERVSGEVVLDETLLLLCELNDVQIPELPELRASYEQQQARTAERMQLMESAGGWDEILQREAESSEGMLLKLRCTRCRREYTYDVGTVYYDLNALDQSKDQRSRRDKSSGDEFWFQKRVVCKKCGAVDEYALTGEANIALLAEQMKMHLASKETIDTQQGTPRLKFYRFGLTDGRQMPPRRALEVLQQEAEAAPQDVSRRVRLGNVLRFMERFEEAREEYAQAVALAPDDLEAVYNLATIEERLGHWAESRPLFERVLALAAQGRGSAKMRAEFVQNARAALAHLDRIARDPIYRAEEERHLGESKPHDHIMPSWSTASEPGTLVPSPRAPRATSKVGRNDPCPCGSGKKYKHCHGR
ncbi:MAG: SEC-C domain-containing protein [Chloroflexi bacterium]|nr:SEC-C domain-containing protein [Chloroflexota bacterium]